MGPTPTISLEQWRALVAVVDEGGYAAAAEASAPVLGVAVVHPLHQGLRIAIKRGERRAQFVGQVRDEVGAHGLIRFELGNVVEDKYPYAAIVRHPNRCGARSKVVLRRNDLLIFATDGIDTNFMADVHREDAPQRIADRVLDRHIKGNDDALVLVVRYQGGGHE